jgi:hypothetical protein
MSNSDSNPSAFPLALFADQSPSDCAASIATLADFLAEIQIDNFDHFGLHVLHGVIRDSSAALSKRLAA